MVKIIGRGLAFLPYLVALAVWFIQRTPIVDADTPRYLANDPMRTATYPLFLDLLSGPALLPVQLLLFAAAASWLAVHSQRYLPPLFVAALVLAVLGNPYVWQLQASIMTEAVTIPILTVMLGLFIGFFVRPSIRTIGLIALLGGLATTIRPPILPFIIAPLAAAWLAKENRARMIATALVLWLVPVGLERAYSRAVHGDRVTSALGRSVFMKAAMIEAPPTPAASSDPLDHRLTRALNEDFAPVRAMVRRAPSPKIRYILNSNYEACAGYPCAESLMRNSPYPEHVRHERLFAAGLARLKANPRGYVELNAEDYLKLWLLHPRKVPTIAKDYNAFLGKEGKFPFSAELGHLVKPTPESEQSMFYSVNRVAFATLGLLALLLPLLFVFYRPNGMTRVSLVILGGMQLALVVGSFVATGLPRYPMGLWPLLIGGIFIGLYGLWRGSRAARIPRAADTITPLLKRSTNKTNKQRNSV